jgi:hypothetical protein
METQINSKYMALFIHINTPQQFVAAMIILSLVLLGVRSKLLDCMALQGTSSGCSKLVGMPKMVMPVASPSGPQLASLQYGTCFFKGSVAFHAASWSAKYTSKWVLHEVSK